MAIPLRVLSSSDSGSHRPRFSMDSEASAILSYALGKERPDNGSHTSGDDDDDGDESDIEVHTTPLNAPDDEEAFLKENDPLTPDYDPPPFKRVFPLSVVRGSTDATQKSRKFRLCAYIVAGVLVIFWLGALMGYLSKGYFHPHRAPASPIAAARRITFDQV